MAPERIPAIPAAVIHHPALGRVSVSQQPSRVPCLYRAGLPLSEFLRGHLMKLRLLTTLLLCLPLAACGNAVHWKQEVLLLDGRVIIVERESEQTGKLFPQNISMEKSQFIAFTNPDTGEKVSWSIPQGLKPYALDFDNRVPYLVLNAYTVADYNTWNCPNPPYLVYRHESGNWVPIPFDQLPDKFVRRNLVDI